MNFLLDFYQKIRVYFAKIKLLSRRKNDDKLILKGRRQFQKCVSDKDSSRRSKHKWIKKGFRSQKSSTLTPSFKYQNGSDISAIGIDQKSEIISAAHTLKKINRLFSRLPQENQKTKTKLFLRPTLPPFRRTCTLSLWDRLATEKGFTLQEQIL